MARTPEEVHDFANVTQTLIWKGVVAIKAARSTIAESRLLCDRARELLGKRGRPQAARPQ